MKILTTPWKSDLLELVANSKDSVKITSPFVKEDVCREILGVKQSNSTFELITSFKLINIYAGSLDLSAIDMILSNNGIVKNFSRLHSKVYIFDNKRAVISSGNLTNGGLLRNYEYGVLIDDKKLVSKICEDFEILSKNENTGTIKTSDLEAVKGILENVPKNKSVKLPRYNIEVETPEEILDIIEFPTEAITKELSGWKLDVFDCVNKVSKQKFTLTDVYSFENHLKSKYPSNNNVKDKIRQQLQYLRDLGLIEFLGSGRYKKLWK